jgi:hypothetical protein
VEVKDRKTGARETLSREAAMTRLVEQIGAQRRPV